MKFIKRFFKWLLILLIVANVLLLATGNSHLYKALSLTYFIGRTGPSIDDYTAFENREVKTGTPQPWAISSRYNATPLKPADKQYHEGIGTVAYLIIKNDSILHESYWDGYNQNSLSNSFSMAKSIVSVLVGCAIGDGLIKDINEPIANYLPEYKDVTGDKVTIRHLLTMSSGIGFDESYGNPFGMMAKAYYGKHLKEEVHKYKPATEPGKQFNYLGGNTLLLGFLVEKVTGKELGNYASEKIWQPIGAQNAALWTIDGENGDERSYCCFYSNARDFAKLGKLYRDSGRWNNNQLVPQNYVLQSISPASDVMDGNQPLQVYGYQWWCINYKGTPMFYARGILGQYIIVNPTTNTIIVRLGHRRESKYINGHPADVIKYLEMAEYIN
jgi:CubicO group peptidase (beta-lactamase class C family)